jgi:hypothetical protein
MIGRADWALAAQAATPEGAAEACRYLGLDVLEALREIAEFTEAPVARALARRRLVRSLAELQLWLARGADRPLSALAFRREDVPAGHRLALVSPARSAEALAAGRIRIEEAALPLWALVAGAHVRPDLLAADGAPILFGSHPTGARRLTVADARAIVRGALAGTVAFRALAGLFGPDNDARPH